MSMEQRSLWNVSRLGILSWEDQLRLGLLNEDHTYGYGETAFDSPERLAGENQSRSAHDCGQPEATHQATYYSTEVVETHNSLLRQRLLHCLEPLEHLQRFSALRPSTISNSIIGPWRVTLSYEVARHLMECSLPEDLTPLEHILDNLRFL